MIQATVKKTATGPVTDGGAQLLLVKTCGSVAIWGGRNNIATVVFSRRKGMEEGQNIQIPVIEATGPNDPEARLDFSAFEEFKGEVSLRSGELAFAGPDSVPSPLPTVVDILKERQKGGLN